MKISKIGKIFTVLGIVLVLGYLIFSVWSFSSIDKAVVCKNLEINLLDKEKIQLISQTEIADILESKNLNPIGKTYKRLRTESIEEELMRNPMIKEVECYKTPAGVVHLTVKQRSPKFMIAGMENFYVDTDRKIFPVSLNHAVYVPIVSGRITKSLATGELFDFVTYIESSEFWNAQVEQIYVRDDLKIELIPRVGDAVIMLGELNNFEQKLNNLYVLYSKGFNLIGWNRYKEIDLQYSNQIVCRKTGATHKLPAKEVIQNNDSSVVKVL